MAARLVGDGDCSLRFAKGAVAAIEFEGQIEPRRRGIAVAGDGEIAGRVTEAVGGACYQ